MTESEWTRAVVMPALKSCNCMVFAVVGGAAQRSDSREERAPVVMQQPGWPDRYVHHKYWAGWLEIKGEKTRVTDLQAKVMRELNNRRPGSAFVLRLPGLIESESGETLADLSGFEWTGIELIRALHALTRRLQ